MFLDDDALKLDCCVHNLLASLYSSVLLRASLTKTKRSTVCLLDWAIPHWFASSAVALCLWVVVEVSFLTHWIYSMRRFCRCCVTEGIYIEAMPIAEPMRICVLESPLVILEVDDWLGLGNDLRSVAIIFVVLHRKLICEYN
jgi:hypothetical protein